MRRHVKRLGRRGGLLLMLAVLWVGVAAQIAATRTPYDVADAVLHERIPLGWRVGLWSVSAAIMLVGAVAGNRCPSWQRAGYGAALFMPAERAMGYAYSPTTRSCGSPSRPRATCSHPRRRS